MSQQNPFVEFVRLYRSDPVSFCREVVGHEPDPWQAEMLMAIAQGERRIAVRSGHGVGKTFGASVAMLWFFLTRFPVKVVVTAPTGAQLYDALFAEVKSQFRALPPMLAQLVELKADRIELRAAPEEAFISARTSRAESPEALQGVHSEHVLLIGDEASGIPEAVFEAARGSMSGKHATTLLLGNPTRTSGYFFRCFSGAAGDRWWTRRVSCLDSKRVDPAFVREVIEDYGEESNQYRIRVLGEFPATDDDTLISMDLVEAAMSRDITPAPTSTTVWGVDVARFGNDRSVLVRRHGMKIGNPTVWRQLDLMQLTGAIKAEWDETAPSRRPLHIYVDSVGLGSGVVDRLRELNLPVMGVNVSETPAMAGKYANLRAELWDRLKQALTERNISLPRDERLLSELTSVRYTYSSSGKLQLETKDAMRKRGLASPDIADAIVMTFAGTAATALFGRSGAYHWNKPLKRNLKGVA